VIGTLVHAFQLPGPHLLTITVDPEHQYWDCTLGNNVYFFSFYVEPLKPDLEIFSEDITFSNPYPFIGDSVHITATVRNVGALDVGNISVCVEIDDDQIGEALTIGFIPYSGNNHRTVATIEWWTATDWPSTQHICKVSVDPSWTIDETDENNNIATRALLVNVCDCRAFGDVNLDGTINPLDVIFMVNYVYKQQDQRQQLPRCPGENGDWDCTDTVNPVDIVFFVNYVYKLLGQPCNPCAP